MSVPSVNDRLIALATQGLVPVNSLNKTEAGIAAGEIQNILTQLKAQSDEFYSHGQPFNQAADQGRRVRIIHELSAYRQQLCTRINAQDEPSELQSQIATLADAVKALSDRIGPYPAAE